MASLPAPSVSVVIVVWNSADHLPRCLSALSAQTFRDFETILVDNASSDGSLEALRGSFSSSSLHIERLPANMGFAGAVNVGARLARGTWLALLNPDAFPDSRWLEALMLAARAYSGAFFASRQIQADRPELLDGEGDVYYVSGLAFRHNYNARFTPPGPPREVFSACAAAALYPRSEFMDSGGFDEDYFAYHEDVDLGFRLRLRGLRCILVPAAVVHHIGAGSSSPRGAFAIYHGHRNMVWTFVKNMPSLWLWLYLPLHLLANLFSIVYFAAQGHGAVVLGAKRDALLGLPRALRKRFSVQAQRRVSVDTVLRPMNRRLLGPFREWARRQASHAR